MSKGQTRCVEGRIYRHDPQHDDPDLETDIGQCPECEGRGCEQICKECRLSYRVDEDADEFGTGLCYECFEEGVERAEERRRERIARANEY